MSDEPSDPPFQLHIVNGFVYRFNTQTGELWRLDHDASDKKLQVWKAIAQPGPHGTA
jgi:hypothetical protein